MEIITTIRDRNIAHELSNYGIEFSEALRDEVRPFFKTLTDSYVAIAAALSLTWTRHAQLEEAYVRYSAAYIDGTVAYDSAIAIRYQQRFGADALDDVLLNYRKYYRNIRTLMPDFNACDVHSLIRLQERLLNRLNALRNERSVVGIGPWLFTGPFKIILSDQDRLWNNNGLNAIVLPTGIEVDKGIERLISEGYGFMDDFDLNWLEAGQGENSLLDNYATYNIVHEYISRIGTITSTPAIHINSALYLYGKNEI
jgi:hypothetical protein